MRPDGRAAVAVLIATALMSLPAACSRRALADDAGGIGHVGADAGLDVGAGGGADGGLDVGAEAGDVATADGGRDGNEDGALADADGTAIPCGATTCTGTDLCVQTDGCGGPLNCVDEIDAGGCPPASTYNTTCLSVTGRACAPDCPPPSHVCVPVPATCTGKPNCNCLGASFCKFGTCQGVQGRLAECAAA